MYQHFKDRIEKLPPLGEFSFFLSRKIFAAKVESDYPIDKSFFNRIFNRMPK